MLLEYIYSKTKRIYSILILQLWSVLSKNQGLAYHKSISTSIHLNPSSKAYMVGICINIFHIDIQAFKYMSICELMANLFPPISIFKHSRLKLSLDK